MANPARGTLVLVVGPSGAGKDSLIAGARAHFQPDARFRFPQRFVTRPVESGGEPHLPIGETEFEGMVGLNGFALHWRAHNLGYGVPADIAADLAQGYHVVVNVSRSVIETARRAFPPVAVACVNAAPALLRARLEQRRREDGASIRMRLARAAAFQINGPNVTHFENDGPLEQAVIRFCHFLETLIADP